MTQALFSPDPPSPSLFHDFEVQPEEAKSILRPQKDARYGWGFSLNPYRGCSHGCRYCYVREYPAPVVGHSGGGTRMDGPDPAYSSERRRLHDPLEWGRWVTPKLNAPELLWAQRHRLHNESVFMSGATDPYQPIERDFRLTQKCLRVLLACPTTEVIIHTRSPLVLQDLGLLRAFGDRLSVGLSIPTDDDAVRKVVEPDSPSIQSRWGAVEQLAKAGIRVGISATPLLAVRDIAAFATRVRESGAKSAWAGGLRLLKNDPFYAVLAEHRWLHVLDPDYVDRVQQAFKASLRERSKSSLLRKRSKPGDSCSRSPIKLIPEPVWASDSRIANPPRTIPGYQPPLFIQAS